MGLGSKLLQHSSSPSKPLVTSCKCGASDELLPATLSYHGCLVDTIPTLKSLGPSSRGKTCSVCPSLLNTLILLKYCMYVVHSNWLSLHKEPDEKKGEIKPGKCWQWETYLVHNSQRVKPHSQDTLLFITYKNASGRCKQHIYSKCNSQSFGMVGRSLSVRLFMSKNTCNKPLYICLSIVQRNKK